MAALTESGEHLLGLVNDVLDYARLGAGRVELAPAPVDVEDLLRSVCELLSPRAHEKGVEIGWAADAGLAPILADEGRLRQILLNFAGNAVKFVETGGVLLLAERAGGGRLRFTVSDTGPGVPRGRAGAHFRSLHPGRARATARARAARDSASPSPAGSPRPWAARLGVGGVGARAPTSGSRRRSSAAGAAAADRRWPAAPSPSSRPAPSCARPPAARSRPAAAAPSAPSGVDEALARTDEGDVILVDQRWRAAARALTPPPGRAAVVLLQARRSAAASPPTAPPASTAI